ncbi:MAG: hypothetical protein DI533_21415 [Cereibacter sphaeroides]|uniref:Uncharacterized protein n=1 Tax=Cereibacter sphaeroides TaxID=1063 RepID=A0A2W5RW01_CERSP|nr:MAG: hypothetical protein DI533_21415 [Cereibacter sphaeroides]
MQHPANLVEALLIGGPHDGKRITLTEGTPQIMMPSPLHASAIQYLADTMPTAPGDQPLHTYTRSGFGITHEGRRGMFYLYIHESLPAHPIAAVQMLYDGYRKPDEAPKWDHDLAQLPRDTGGWRGW